MKKNTKKVSAATSSESQNQLLDQRTRLSPEQAKAVIMKVPATTWNNTVTDKEPVLTYQVQYSAHKGQEENIRRLIGASTVFNFNSPMSGKMLIAQASGYSRIASVGKSIYGADFVAITAKSGGFLFCDSKSKTYIQMGKEQQIDTYFPERFKATTTVTPNKREVVIEISSPYKLKYILHLDGRAQWKPYVRDVIATIIGCPDMLAAAGIDLEPVIKAGMPVKGDVFMLSGEDEWETMSSFSVSFLSVATGRSKLFDIPSGYRNMRESVNTSKPTQPTKITLPGVKFSDIQKPAYVHTASRRTSNKNNRITEDFSSTVIVQGIPSCFPETYGAKISDLVDERALDDVAFLINAASKRLSNFSGNNGTITMDWLKQVQTQANSLPSGAPGTGLFTLLHWDGTGSENLGLLDKLALKSLGSLLAQGNNLSDIGLSPALQAVVNGVLGNAAIAPQDRFSSLSVNDQHALVVAYVFNKIGTIHLTYPSSSGTQSLAGDLLEYQVTDISFDIAINNTAIIHTFQFDGSGINLIVDLPDASGSGSFSAWVTWKYWAAVAAVTVACIFSFGAACTLSPILIAVGVFVALTSGDISIDLQNLMINAQITMVPNAFNVLQPQVSLLLNATVNASYSPNVSLGVNNLLGDIAVTVADNTNLVINAIQSQLQNKLNNYLQNDLHVTYPPQFGPVTLSGLGVPFTDFKSDDFGYAEQTLNAGSLGIIDPYVTQLDAIVEPNIITLRSQFEAQFTDPETALQSMGGDLISWSKADFTNIARYYAGTVLSQNFINYFIYTLWRDGTFDFNFTVPQTKVFYLKVLSAFPHSSLPPYRPSMKAHLWPSVPPRTLFTPVPASLGENYATTFFDDVRLCFELPTDRTTKESGSAIIEFSFAAQASTEIGFGGFDSSINQLNLLKASDRVFDIYFEQGVKIIEPEVQYFTLRNMQPSINFDYSPLNSLQNVFIDALRLALASRSATFIPHGTGDPQYIQRYALGTHNAFGPKNKGNPLAAVFQLVPFRGNLYVSQGVSGMATGIFQGTNALDIDTMSSFVAELILAIA